MHCTYYAVRRDILVNEDDADGGGDDSHARMSFKETVFPFSILSSGFAIAVLVCVLEMLGRILTACWKEN